MGSVRCNRHNRQGDGQQCRQNPDSLADRVDCMFRLMVNLELRHRGSYRIISLVPDIDEQFMHEALRLAREADGRGEVPVGAVLVIGGEICGSASNSPIAAQDPTAHAEMLALRQAARCLGNYRLTGATLYCTLEPCVMCAGALVAARVDRVIFGARDLRFGGVRSKFQIADSPLLNHRVEVVEGVLAVECVELLRRFLSPAVTPRAGQTKCVDRSVDAAD